MTSFYHAFFIFAFVLVSFDVASVYAGNFSSSLPLKLLDVGNLRCYNVKSGALSLYNTKTRRRQYVTIANNYTLGEQIHNAATNYSLDLPLLSSFKEVEKEDATFEFLACVEHAGNSKFQDFVSSKNGRFYGHLSPLNGASNTTGLDEQGNPGLCTTNAVVYADTAYLAAQKCYYGDDVKQVPFYFSYAPGKEGQVKFIGHTGPNGGKPQTADNRFSEYDFVPGKDATSPAIYVHFGSPKFSDWVLQLQ